MVELVPIWTVHSEPRCHFSDLPAARVYAAHHGLAISQKNRDPAAIQRLTDLGLLTDSVSKMVLLQRIVDACHDGSDPKQCVQHILTNEAKRNTAISLTLSRIELRMEPVLLAELIQLILSNAGPKMIADRLVKGIPLLQILIQQEPAINREKVALKNLREKQMISAVPSEVAAFASEQTPKELDNIEAIGDDLGRLEAGLLARLKAVQSDDITAEFDPLSRSQTSSVPDQTTQKESVELPDKSEAINEFDDFGEKIGGSRKDNAVPGRSKRIAPDDNTSTVPSIYSQFIVMETVNSFRFMSDRPNKPPFCLMRKANAKARHGQGQFIGYFDTREKAEAAIPKAAVSLKHAITKQGDEYAIYRKVATGKYPTIEAGFSSREAAERYLVEHATAIIQTKLSFDDSIRANLAVLSREGPILRDHHVDEALFIKTFGFYGVEFGQWTNKNDRQSEINLLYDGLLDLARVLQVEPDTLSLNGELAIALGARGRGLTGARAHYDARYGVINITKMKGAGTLAHEWFHALDHYLCRLAGIVDQQRSSHPDFEQPVFGLTKAGNLYTERASRYPESSNPIGCIFDPLRYSALFRDKEYVDDPTRAEKIVNQQYKNVQENLRKIRRELAEDLSHGSKKRFAKPATDLQLTRFDELSAACLQSVKDLTLALELRRNPGGRSFAGTYRQSNDTLDEMSAMYKKVRGRAGFKADHRGRFNLLSARMEQALSVTQRLTDAKEGRVKHQIVASNYCAEATKIDLGTVKDYWSKPTELLARAFESYVEDTLQGRGERNDYLVHGANNDMANYQLFDVKPFPEKNERALINLSFERLINVLHQQKVLKPAPQLLAGSPKTVSPKHHVNRMKL